MSSIALSVDMRHELEQAMGWWIPWSTPLAQLFFSSSVKGKQ
jgi:hypothetical protein